ncbi:MAG: porphobilinogen synthase [Pseudomonadota bacterium]
MNGFARFNESGRLNLPVRPRRNRAAAWSRDLVRETTLGPSDFVWPLFIAQGHGVREPIAAMPGVERLSVDLIPNAVREARDLGIPAVALFPNTPDDAKSIDGAESINPDNLMCRALKAAKDAAPEVGVMADVALDPYTDHGHCGILRDGVILNDETVEQLCRSAIVQAEAGADVLSPSDMMDGRIGAIRAALDDAGYSDRLIVSYAAKYASAFYGPFREAVGSSGSLKGDKRTYQMDPGNRREALREARLDVEEGADMLIVKPGLAYLDILREVSDAVEVPTLSYQVSGEYAMLEAAIANGWLDADRVILESLLAFKRAGAAGILTYYAPKAARLLGA